MNPNCEFIQQILIDNNLIKPIVYIIFEYLETVENAMFQLDDEIQLKQDFKLLISTTNSESLLLSQFHDPIIPYINMYLIKRNRLIFNYFKYYSFKPALYSTLQFIDSHIKMLTIKESHDTSNWIPSQNECKILAIQDFPNKSDYFLALGIK